MSSEDHIHEESGSEAARAPDSRSTSPGSQFLDGMKRAAAKQLIEAYYFQLTDGCGNCNCDNNACATCPDFTFKDLDKNKLALQAVQLFRAKAQLCEPSRCKVAKMPVQESQGNLAGNAASSKFEEEKISSSKPVAESSQPKPCTSSETKPTEKRHTQILTEEKIQEIVDSCKQENSWSKLIRTIGSVFNNAESLMLSFQKKPDLSLPKEQLRQMEQDCDKDIDEKEDSDTVEQLPIPVLNPSQDVLKTGEITVDIQSLRRAYSILMEIPDHPFQNSLIHALLSLARDIEMDLRYKKPLDTEPYFLNIFVVVMEIPFLHSPEYIESAYPELCKAVGLLPLKGQVRLAQFWSQVGAERLQEMVESLQQLITVKLIDDETRWGRGYYVNDEDRITGPIKMMKILYYASLLGGEKDSAAVLEEEKDLFESDEAMQDLLGAGAMGPEAKEPKQQREDPLAKELGVNHLDFQPLVPFEDFINETLNENINVETDFRYKFENEGKFSFSNYSFVLSPATKHTIMYFDNRVRMINERRANFFVQLFTHRLPPMPFLRLRVRRDHLIDDALVSLEMTAMENPSDLKKQLFVEFEGEQGLDEGGVSKEFFQLVIEEIFNPDFGMFTYNEETHNFWFNPTSFENDGQFTLIGIMLGLAIYNSTIVDVHFPSVVYSKLMGKKGVFRDLKYLEPTLAQSLEDILAYDGDDLEDVFMQTFRIGYKDVFGSSLTHDLKENGDGIPVTQQNKREFVDLYSDFLLNKSIEKQFRAFKRGFQMVTSESPLRTLFRPSELELLICGSDHFDFYALEKSTDYDGGFEETSQSIKNFWEVVHEFTDEQKRQLLAFTTGTDRVPVGGLAKLKLIIARNGPDSERLPTAHTCFNVLLLPDYATKEKLKERLLKAITYSKGFGML